MRRFAPGILFLACACVAWLVWAAVRVSTAPIPAVPAESIRLPGAGESALTPTELSSIEARGRSRIRAEEKAGESSLTEAGPSDRHGLSILLLDPRGKPLPDVGISVSWRRGEGDYVEVTGTTDGAGILPTAVPDPREIEGIQLAEELRGFRLFAGDPFEVSPERPGVVAVRIPGDAAICGTVRDLEGRPIASASVEIESAPALGMEPYLRTFGFMKTATESAADGSFRFATLEGCFAITATAEGFDATEQAYVRLAPGGDPPVVDLALAGAERELRVIVRASGQLPRGPTQVRAWTAVASGPAPSGTDARILRESIPVQRSGVPDDPGNYRLRISRAGTWTVGVSSQGYADAQQPVPPRSDEIVFDLARQPENASRVAIRGRVTTPGGPVDRVKVQALLGRDLEPEACVTADASGSFEVEVERTAASVAFLIVERSGFARAGVGPIPLAKPPLSVDVVLEPELSLSGIVVDELGRPASAVIDLRPPWTFFRPLAGAQPAARTGFLDRPVGIESFYAYAAEDGRFRIEGIAPGEHELWIEPDDPLLPPARVVARAGEEDVRIVLGKGLEDLFAIWGTVRDGLTGMPVAGVSVVAGSTVSAARREGRSRTDPEGRFRIAGCTPGARLAVGVDADGYAYFQTEPRVFLARDLPLALEILPARTLRLLVVDLRGEPLAGIYVSAADAKGRAIELRDAWGHRDEEVAVTDLAGRVDLRGLPGSEIAAIVGRRSDGEDPVVTNAAFQTQNASQPPAMRVRFDLRKTLPGVQRVVLAR
jgi:hypothetical protein